VLPSGCNNATLLLFPLLEVAVGWVLAASWSLVQHRRTLYLWATGDLIVFAQPTTSGFCRLVVSVSAALGLGCDQCIPRFMISGPVVSMHAKIHHLRSASSGPRFSDATHRDRRRPPEIASETTLLAACGCGPGGLCVDKGLRGSQLGWNQDNALSELCVAQRAQ
jgi:hypothetical protein